MSRKSPFFPGVWRLSLAALLGLSVAGVSVAGLGSAWAKPKPASGAAKKKPPHAKDKDRPVAKDASEASEGSSEAAPAAAAGPSAPGAGAGDDSRALQRGERVEFDGRLIQGQTAKAGAVYLFARVSTNLTSMVNAQSSFRDKVVRTVFPEDARPARAAAEVEKTEPSKEEKKEPEGKKRKSDKADKAPAKEAAP